MSQLQFMEGQQSEKWNYTTGVRSKTQKNAIFLVREPGKEAPESQRM